jgi:hypothetical protein
MNVSGQLQAPAALLQEKRPLVTTKKIMGAPQSLSECCKEKKGRKDTINPMRQEKREREARNSSKVGERKIHGRSEPQFAKLGLPEPC